MTIVSTLSSTGDRGTPTAGGEYYENIYSWESGQQKTCSEPEVLECYIGTTTPDTSWLADGTHFQRVDINGWVTTQTNNITIRPVSGEEAHDFTSGFTLAGDGTQTILQVDGAIDLDVKSIRIQSDGSQACFQTGTGGSGVSNLERCVLRNTYGSSEGRVVRWNQNKPGSMINCLAMSDSPSGNSSYSLYLHASAAVTISNCDFINSSSAVACQNGGSVVVVKNSLAYNIPGTANAWASTGFGNASNTNNASSSSGAPGDSSVVNLTPDAFVDLVGRNFRPAEGGVLEGAGVNLSGDFTDDLDGNTRVVPWEIGAYDIQGGVVPTPPTNVEAGGAYSGTVGTPIAIDGASFTPGVGSADVILWTFIGPGGTWDDDSILSPTFTPDGVDTYALTLTVENDEGSAADTASLTSGAVLVEWNGPDIVAQTGTEDVLFSFQENGGGTVASRFTGATAYALAPTSDALPTGLTINEITGNIEGTPTVAGEFTNIIIEGSEQPLFNFNGTDQYATHTAWECLGDPAVYESVTYGADPDDGFIIGAARPITEIGRVGANYHAGPAWGVQYNDSSPIQDTDALMGSGFRYIVIPQFTIPAGDDFEISADVIRGSATLNEYIFGSPNRNDDSYVVYAVGGGGTSSAAIILGGEVLTVPDAAFDSVAEGQHYRMSYRRTSGLVEAFVNDVFASSKVMNGEHIVSAFMSGASTHAQNTFQSGAMQNVILENLTTQEYVRYAIDEGEGLSVKAYDRSGDEIPASAGTITPDADWQNIPNNSRHYPMNEGTGATLFDTVGGHDATIQNFTDEWQ